MQYQMINLAFATLILRAVAFPSPTPVKHVVSKRAELPASAGSQVLSAVQVIAAGETFDGGLKTFDRGVECTGQAEGGESDAVFNIEAGGSLSNVIIGPNQLEGIHCQGGCTLTNVWWADVCEDAFSIKIQDASETTTINGGGAFAAADKVIQHNGAGKVVINDFYVEDFGKLYRSCGNCKVSNERHVELNGITAVNGGSLVGINSNFGDTAILSGISATEVDDQCVVFEGVSSGSEPTEIGVDIAPACTFTDGATASSSAGNNTIGAGFRARLRN
ncbi:pectate lyase [Phlyctema vagabunda]|uniref:Pectate lyase n=1 Tax=Phlyctema vagabunda TaxID=108571 RepID=A0ABR4PJY9_9HELO